MELIPRGTKIDFMGFAKIPITISILVIIGTFYLWFSLGETKYGVDFKGGNEFVVEFKTPTDSGAVGKSLTDAQIKDPIVQAFLGSNQFSVRIGGDIEAKVAKTSVENALKAVYKDQFQIVKTDFIGPTIGAELRYKALLATVIALIGIALYVGFRFEAAFAVGALASLFHDVIASTGIYLLLGHEFSMGTVAAALTVVGYSVNDTIVVFDRVREEILKSDKFDPVQIFNYAVNFCLGRTIVTTMIAWFAVITLWLFGGKSIEDLNLFLVVGVFCGGYSTIFIAAPCVLMWERFRSGKPAGAGSAAKAA